MKTEAELRKEISALLCVAFGPVCEPDSKIVSKLNKIIEREVQAAHDSHELDALGEDL